MIKELKDEIEKTKKENEEMKKELKEIVKEKNKEKDEMMGKINLLIEENKKIKEKIDKIKINGVRNEGKSSSSPLFEEINKNNFSKNPNNFKLKGLLTSNHSSAGMLANFAVFIGLRDNIPYLVYNNKLNFNLEVMNLNDNTIVHFL